MVSSLSTINEGNGNIGGDGGVTGGVTGGWQIQFLELNSKFNFSPLYNCQK